MKVNTFAFSGLALAGIVLLAGCTGDGAFVHRPYEIDRGSANFPDGPNLLDGDTVTVCYRSRAATPSEVQAIAASECARFGLTAMFVEQHYETCPAIAPRAVVFECSGGIAESSGGLSAGSVTSSAGAFAPSASSVIAPQGGIGAADVSTTAKSEPFPRFLLRPAPGN